MSEMNDLLRAHRPKPRPEPSTDPHGVNAAIRAAVRGAAAPSTEEAPPEDDRPRPLRGGAGRPADDVYVDRNAELREQIRASQRGWRYL
jgi:hypothetical protein